MLKAWALMSCLLCSVVGAEPLRVAVASNAAGVMEAVLDAYAETSPNPNPQAVTLSSGSTGQLYAQIIHGAPFDLFIAADEDRPNRLLLAGQAQSVQPLLLGRLVLVGPRSEQSCDAWLQAVPQGKVALANPKLAPYGQASVEVLKHLQVWEQLKPHVVYGQNVSQTWQYIQTGNAVWGLVAQSMLKNADLADHCTWVVPASMHQPIVQGLAVLDAEQAADFLKFLHSQTAQSIFADHGYQLP